MVMYANEFETREKENLPEINYNIYKPVAVPSKLNYLNFFGAFHVLIFNLMF